MTAAYEVLAAYEQDTPEWHAQRAQGIGASDVAPILGLSPWQTRLDIYRAKKGVRSEIPEDLAWFGHALEPVISDWVAHKHPQLGEVFEGSSLRSKDWPWLAAAPDRLVVSDGGFECPLELKSSSAWGRESWIGGIPIYYAAQLQAQMAVLGAPFGYLAVLHGGNAPELHGPIERDVEFIDNVLVPETREFWFGHVLKDNPPEPVTTSEAVTVWPGDPTADAVEADDDLYGLWQELMAVRREKDQAANDAEKLALELQKALGDATELRHDGQVLATWKPQAGARRLDTTLLRKDHPDLADAYTKPGDATRRFLVKEPRKVQVDA